MNKLKNEVLDWMIDGSVGVSSKAIAMRAVGKIKNKAFDYPCDADDFSRCYEMLKACPAVKIERMRGFNKVWDNLVDSWIEITQLYELEDWAGVRAKIRSCSSSFSKDGITESLDVLY